MCCVKKSKPQNVIFYLWFPIVMGPPDSDFYSKKVLEIFYLTHFAKKICTNNDQINTTQTGEIFTRSYNLNQLTELAVERP